METGISAEKNLNIGKGMGICSWRKVESMIIFVKSIVINEKLRVRQFEFTTVYCTKQKLLTYCLSMESELFCRGIHCTYHHVLGTLQSCKCAIISKMEAI